MLGYTACLAHLADPERAVYLAGLEPGDDVDHRGTSFTAPLLSELLGALRDPGTGQPHLGVAGFGAATFEGDAGFGAATFEGEASFESATFKDMAWFGSAKFKDMAWFDSATFEDTAGFGTATFEGEAGFESATFEGDAGFRSATFKGDAGFESATFKDRAWFDLATFEDDAWFESTTFEGEAAFDSATFKGRAWFGAATFKDRAGFGAAAFEDLAGFESASFKRRAGFESASFKRRAEFESASFECGAWFRSATFEGRAGFGTATFEGSARFESATFEGDAWFGAATFKSPVDLGPFVCAGRVSLVGAVFGGPMTLSCVARRVECRRTRWMSTAELRLRYTTVDFSHAVFEYPLTIAAEAAPFVLSDGRPVTEQALAGAPDATVRIVSLRGVDAAHLVLADVDLSGCLFTGTVHLDQIRLEGACTFDTVPPAMHWRGWRPIRFTQRRTLAEEHHWRASQAGAVPGWNVAVFGAGRVGPLQLAPVYRALRKALEDGKHEPGAADFYYGEMEMRRHADDIPRSERGLLTAYWALSGYGMRASRALAWLGAAMLVTIVLLMGLGLPKDTPKQAATGTVPAGGGKVTFEIDEADPQNPTGERLTGERFDKALNVTLNSVVFRSADQDLTTSGTYIEMASRVTEPILLGLAVLAVRNRVKR
ncbi:MULTISPECIES: pentapeptide repeat-containing protein [unclassified Streptomyces]|uniref:pentapeptide repeat-containing protein n=1 Tax=unclassified Streptomyces TaxID=2593676 RepID=UPI00224F1A62|nr:pentapeptide repeat-containing protein [Streptomyces sp. NBC_00063]MCX5443768.1 pentapeptide repeat-containing protein [Streptomyces sp. NBC_00063]